MLKNPKPIALVMRRYLACLILLLAVTARPAHSRPDQLPDIRRDTRYEQADRTLTRIGFEPVVFLKRPELEDHSFYKRKGIFICAVSGPCQLLYVRKADGRFLLVFTQGDEQDFYVTSKWATSNDLRGLGDYVIMRQSTREVWRVRDVSYPVDPAPSDRLPRIPVGMSYEAARSTLLANGFQPMAFIARPPGAVICSKSRSPCKVAPELMECAIPGLRECNYLFFDRARQRILVVSTGLGKNTHREPVQAIGWMFQYDQRKLQNYVFRLPGETAYTIHLSSSCMNRWPVGRSCWVEAPRSRAVGDNR